MLDQLVHKLGAISQQHDERAPPRRVGMPHHQAVPVAPSAVANSGNSTSSSSPRARLVTTVLCGFGMVRGRYTLAKFQDFDHYSRSTSRWHHTTAILLTPVPSLIASLIPTLIRLQNPRRGVAVNHGTLLRHALSHLARPCLPDPSIHRSVHTDCLEPRSCGHRSAHIGPPHGLRDADGLYVAPFVWVTAYLPFLMLFVYSSLLVLRSKVWNDASVRGPLLGFLPSYVVQSLQVVIYPAFSALYEICTEWKQIALTMAYPLLKLGFRRALWTLSSHLSEEADEVAISGVEICAVMYQLPSSSTWTSSKACTSSSSSWTSSQSCHWPSSWTTPERSSASAGALWR